MKETVYTTEVSILSKSIIRMLLYFDIFQYPLNKKELEMVVSNPDKLEDCLNELKEAGVIDQYNEWYFIKGKKYTKRISQFTNSAFFYKKAKKYARIIHKFPFVRGVYISGSLSKDWSDNTTDVDYFIITSPQRLWVCRTLLILFKKVFLLNSKKYFCLNYFIDTSQLKIRERNIFTATEICFLKPVVNESMYHQFIKCNDWIKDFYKHIPQDNAHVIQATHGWVKKMLEWALKGAVGERLDIWAMKKTLKQWRRKFPDLEKTDFEINFKTDRNISKHHPGGFQKRVLQALEERVKEFENTTQILL